LVATGVAPIGGEEVATYELATRLLARGHEVTVISSRCDIPPQPSLRTVRLPIPTRPRALTYLLYMLLGSLVVWRRRRGLLHNVGALVINRADLVSVHFCFHAYEASKRAPRSSRPTAAHRLNEWFMSWLPLLFERLCYRPSRSRHLVSVSRGSAADIRHYFPSVNRNVSVISSAVDLREFRFRPEAGAEVRERESIGPDEVVAIFVGGDWGRKGLKVAIEAVARTRDWHLLVAGSGDLERYRRIAEECGTGDRVHFCGHSKDAAALYSAADAFLLPTSYETFSLVSYEAAAIGLPLLVTNVNGVNELLVDGENGWFVQPDSEDIAARLDYLAEHPEERRRMADAARASRRTYTWQDMAEDYERLYYGLAATTTRA
jgi:glycosyltransferase involved in cell wall biosynthesis